MLLCTHIHQLIDIDLTMMNHDYDSKNKATQLKV